MDFPSMAVFQYITVSLIISFLLSLFMLMKQINKSNVQNPSLLPPGPSRLPVIGHLHHFSKLGRKTFHQILADLALVHGPLMFLKLGEISVIVASSPGIAEAMLKTHDRVAVDRPRSFVSDIMSYGGSDILMAPYGEYWRQVRKTCTLELFCSNRVLSFSSVREEEAANLIQMISLKAGSPINLSEKIFTLTNDIFSRIAFGRTCKEKEAFMASMEEMAGFGFWFAIMNLFPSLSFLEVISGVRPRIEMLHQKFDRIIESIINEHNETQVATCEIKNEADAECLIDVLLRLQRESTLQVPFTIQNVKAVIFDLFGAGTETSSTAIEWTIFELLRNPRVMQKAQAEVRGALHVKNKIRQEDVRELNYLRLVIKESLRLHPPLPLLAPRDCRERCEVHGYEIPKGTKVVVNAWGIGRNPKYWNDPESFIPERFEDEDLDYKGTNFKYIPFGAGRRICPGIMFGIANVELPLALLLYHFDWKFANGDRIEELDVSESVGISVRRKTNLNVIPTLYNSL